MNMSKSIFLLLAIILITSGCIYSNNTTDVTSFNMSVNNTNLAPNVVGFPGTGERMAGVKYFANNSPLYIEIMTHTVNTGQDMIFNFSINDVIVWEYRKQSAILDEHHSMVQMVPRHASYMLNVSTTIHHYEWREYPIIS